MIDYFWGGFSGFAIVFLILAIWQVGSEFSSPLLLPPPKDVFLKACEILKDYKNSEINITLCRSLIGVCSATFFGIFLGLIAGSFKSFAAFLKPVITLLLSLLNLPYQRHLQVPLLELASSLSLSLLHFACFQVSMKVHF